MENHAAQVASFMYAYNFVQPHRSLTRRGGPRLTMSAMAAGVSDLRMRMEVWSTWKNSGTSLVTARFGIDTSISRTGSRTSAA